jgi:hypothetical protein
METGYAADYKRTAALNLYGPDYRTLRYWECQGVWPQAANFGTLDFGTSDRVQVEVTFRVDRAIPRLGESGFTA